MKSFPLAAALPVALAVICGALSLVRADQTKAKPAVGAQAMAEGIKKSRQEMCSFLLARMDTEGAELDLDGVAQLFETALDHLAKASSYVTLMRPFVDKKVIANFDLNGSQLVLSISEARQRLMGEHAAAVKVGASGERLRQLLERYFYKACEFKMNTIQAERAMLDSALKTQKTKQVALFPESS